MNTEDFGDNFPFIENGKIQNCARAFDRINLIENILLQKNLDKITKNDLIDLQIDIELFSRYNNIQ